ncbi:hypothetical protein J5N97_021707 [Dioscorea zingiberensis]|uniref:Uncharacterized protein n=1 Tax=Dioscorea zingiberensis TaxID=325984 RepID=A0A9D5CAH8_9LILI|nr:hypothetical protein J5N97_021707 [Dioscorea zingiberensis]
MFFSSSSSSTIHQMSSQMINSPSNFPILHKVLPSRNPLNFSSRLHPIISSSSTQSKQEHAQASITTPPQTSTQKLNFQTLETCKLSISRYPDFQYNATGGKGTGSGYKEDTTDHDIQVSFDTQTLYIPPLQSSTTRFLGLPLPPFLRVEIIPQLLHGTINQQTGKVELQFKAKFCFSVGSVYKAPPLLVETILTSEESKGEMKSGRGQRMDGEGKCKLVGVAMVEPVNDVLMNSFLGLPTECIADLNACISIS